MEQINSKGIVRKGLDYLVKDYQKTVSDVKKYARPVGIGLLTTLMLGLSMGCPWNKDKDRDTTTGSSGGGPSVSFSYPSDFSKGINSLYGDNTTNFIGGINATNATGVEMVVKDENGVETKIPMNASPTTPTLYTTQTFNLPQGIYILRFDANGASTGEKSSVSVLTPEGKVAWDLRRNLPEIYETSAGVSKTYFASLNFVKESDESLTDIVNSDGQAIVINDLVKELWILENDNTLNPNPILGKGTTLTQYETLLKQNAVAWTNGTFNDLEVPTNYYSIKWDKGNEVLEMTVSDAVGNPTNKDWKLRPESRSIVRDFIDTSVTKTYRWNIKNGGYNNYNPGTGEQIAP